MIIKINNIDDYNYIKENHKEYFYNKTKAEFICSNCNNVSIKSVKCLKIPFLCNNCSCKLSHNTEEYKSNYKNSILKIYGVEHIGESDIIKEKIKRTNLERYGCENVFQSDIIKEKIKNKNLLNLGVEYPGQLKECREKGWQTYKNKTDYDHNMHNPDSKEKVKNTTIKNYGGIGMASDELRKKCESTNLKLYGVKHPIQNTEVFRKTKAKYKFDDYIFDSSWELAYYIWLKDNNIEFEYHPKDTFIYEYNNVMHEYCPDFKINNEFYEIKGDMFFENEKMINPYNRNLDCKMQAKYECMIKNKINILKYDDIKSYLEYISIKYGNNYLKTFKIKDNKNELC